jgi:DNA-binding transcriptional LysR family regulator
MNPDLNSIIVFVKVVELRSFRAAAQSLRVPRSTVSLRITQLEKRLGARLLERTTRSVRVTDAGIAYYREVEPALQAIRDGERVIAGLEAEPTGNLRWTAPADMDAGALGKLLSQYARIHPAVQVQVELTDRRVNLIEDGFDLALRAGPLDDSSLIMRKLGKPERLLCYASADYLRRRGKPVRPEDLLAHDCLVMSGHRQPTLWRFHEGRKLLPVEVRPRIAVNSFAVLRTLVDAGCGIARLPEAQIHSARNKVPLRLVLEEFSPPPMHWHALYPSARNLSPKVRALLELLDRSFARGAG